MLALAVAAAAAVVLLPRHGAVDREEPAVTPQPSVAHYSVFDRPGTPVDRAEHLQPGEVSRRIALLPDAEFFLVRKAGGMYCLDAHFDDAAPADRRMGCGTGLLGGSAAGMMALAVPDGVKEVAVTIEGGAPQPFPVHDNGVALNVPNLPITASYTDQGRQVSLHLNGRVPRSAVFGFSVLKRPQQPGDGLPHHPGARRVLELGDIKVWLYPNGEGVCLFVRDGTDANRACEAQASDGRHPLVARKNSLTALALPDGMHMLPDGPGFTGGGTSLNVAVITGDVASVRLRDSYGKVRRLYLRDSG